MFGAIGKLAAGSNASNARVHQSLPIRSPAFGVSTDHQVVAEIAPFTNRTLPSPRAALMPPVCGELALLGLPQPPAWPMLQVLGVPSVFVRTGTTQF